MSGEANGKGKGKVELVWEGKRTDVERVTLPFQTIETINETRGTRKQEAEDGLDLFWNASKPTDGEWKNRLIWGDNKYVMSSLLDEFAGKIDLIYIDPPFATGANFAFSAQVGDKEMEVLKEQSAIEEVAYRDTWGRGRSSFLGMLYARLALMKDLLSQTGAIYVHLDWRVGPYAKCIMDEIFGDEHFRNEVIWYYSGGGASKEQWARKHDNIFFYTKSDKWTFNVDDVRQAYKWTNGQKRADGSGRDLDKGKLPDDVFDLHGIMPWAGEKTGYETQKPESLLERFVKASSNEGNLVADFFCGSGTTLAVAEKLGRRWIGCDLGRFAIHTTRKRLLDIPKCKPFVVQNLGRYERQYWQGVTFGRKSKDPKKQAVHDYYRFILDLYKAEPVVGMTHLHGRRGARFVHIGATDAPVTFSEIKDAVSEVVAAKQKALDVLGWEWEMGLHDLVETEAKKKGVDLRLLSIPREVMEKRAVEAGDIHFYELAYLEAKVEKEKGRKARVRLENFVIPNPELVPDEVRSKIRKWSDYVDYWAVDFDFQGDTFHNQWQSFRTRKDRTLELVTEWHEYDGPGRRRLLVKVVDIFGNDTTHLLEASL